MATKKMLLDHGIYGERNKTVVLRYDGSFVRDEKGNPISGKHGNMKLVNRCTKVTIFVENFDTGEVLKFTISPSLIHDISHEINKTESEEQPYFEFID